MKTRFLVQILAVSGISLFGASCAGPTTCSCLRLELPAITFQEMLRMPQFTAVVEEVKFHHSLFGKETSVDLLLLPSDGFMPLAHVISDRSDREALGSAHSLSMKRTYVFPQVYVDYVNRTNAVAK